jgi:hypothetical protein
MKLILAITVLLSNLCIGQQTTYSRVTYTYFSTDSTLPSFERTIVQQVVVNVDTVRKRLVIPHLELLESACTKRNIINNVFSSSKDTTLFVQNWNDAFPMTYPYIRNMEQPGVRVLDLSNGIRALQVFNYDYLAIEFPKEGKYIRVIEFIK